MLMILFVEAHGYFFDKDLLVASAGYVWDAFVMPPIGQYAEFEHLEKILMDAVCTEPIPVEDEDFVQTTNSEKYRKYQNGTYTPMPHTPRSST